LSFLRQLNKLQKCANRMLDQTEDTNILEYIFLGNVSNIMMFKFEKHINKKYP